MKEKETNTKIILWLSEYLLEPVVKKSVRILKICSSTYKSDKIVMRKAFPSKLTQFSILIVYEMCIIIDHMKSESVSCSIVFYSLRTHGL